MLKIISYNHQQAKITCDERCDKAWGVLTRPNIQLSDDEDDVVYLSDDELGIAPIDPETYEGGEGKPISRIQVPNKWCVRQCERLSMSECGKAHLPIELKDWSKRRYNQPWKHDA